MKRSILAFLIAVFIGYGPTWAAYYVAWVTGHDQLRVLGSLAQYQTNCTEKESAVSKCTQAFVIPKSIYEKLGSEAAVGAGQIISATRYHCLEPSNYSISVDDPSSPGRTFEIFSKYQTIELSALHCTSGIVIEAWSRKAAVRVGYIGGTAVVGRFTAVERVKRLSEFFTMQLLYGLSVAFVILIVLSETLYRNSGGGLPPHAFEVTLPLWFLNSLIISGIAQTFVPVTYAPLVFNRLSMFLTHLGLLLTPLIVIWRARPSHRRLLVTVSVSLFISLVVAAGSSSFARYLQPVDYFAASVIGIVSIAYGQYEYLVLAVVTCLGCLRIAGHNELPAEYTIYPYYAFTVCFIILAKIRVHAKIAALTQWAQSSEWRKSGGSQLESLLMKLHSEIGAGRTTLLSVSEDGQVKIHSKTGSEPIRSFIRTELPPIFAHVFSVGEPLLHLNANSERYRNIARGALPRDRYDGGYFSIIPVLSESQTVGAVAFTNYPDSWVRSNVRTFLLKHLTRTLESTLVEQIRVDGWRSRGQWAERLLNIQKRLPNANSLADAHAIICEALGCFGFLASLDPETRLFELHAIQGYPSEVDERLRSGRIYAHRENEQGPIALAANQKKTVIIPDVKLLRSVLHENTNLFFEKSKTQSCAAVPVFAPREGSKGESLWGALFLERGPGETFTLEARGVLEQVGTEISELLKRLEQQKAANQALKALSSFVPKRVLQRVVEEKIEREDDQGILVMIDLKSSTKISLKVGSEAWLEGARSIADPLEAIAARYNMTQQYFLWDAFYFTFSTPKPSQEDLARIVKFFDEANAVIRAMYVKRYSEHGSFDHPSERVARVCISFGDVSRGFLQGATKVWTIVGSEMAAISKFEDLCKRLDGAVFCDESLAGALDSTWIDTGMVVSSTGRKVFASRRHSERYQNGPSGQDDVNRAA